MANAHRGEATIHLDRPRTLRYDLNACAEYESATGGTTIIEGLNRLKEVREDGSHISFSAIRSLVWAGLLHEIPDLTLRRAGELIQNAPGGNIAEKIGMILPAIVVAFTDQFATEEQKKRALEEFERAQNALIGESSSASASALSASGQRNSGV